jgi:hypothetical protein
MLIEAMKPLLVHLRSGSVQLTPGHPVDLAEDDALRLLAKAKGKVRLIEPPANTKTDWLAAWRELAVLTYGITEDDPRFEPVMRWLNACDTAFAMDSWSAFSEAASHVRIAAKGVHE